MYDNHKTLANIINYDKKHVSARQLEKTFLLYKFIPDWRAEILHRRARPPRNPQQTR